MQSGEAGGQTKPLELCQLDPKRYELRIAEDGEPDMDFPEMDGSVPITTFGVDEFVLCRVGDWAVELLVELTAQSTDRLEMRCTHPASQGEPQTIVLHA